MLLGREHEVEWIRRAAVAGPRVVLVGPPGVGKTELVRASLPEHGVVDLASQRDVDGVCGAVAHHLGLTDVHGSLVDRIAERLAGRPLVLDHAGHIEGIEGLLEAWSTGRLVVTTQRALAVESALLQVGPLADDHVRTLLGRASAGGDAEVDAIVAHTGGLPLAAVVYARMLELASPRQLLQLLERAGLGRTPLQRAIDLATTHLDAEAARALACVCVFDGPFTLTDAAGVLDPQVSVGVLAGLVDRSLLARRQEEAEVWLHVLPPVRTQLRSTLDDDDPVWDRHARHVTDLAAEASLGWTQHGTLRLLDQVARWRTDLERIVLRAQAPVAARGVRALASLLAAGTPAPSVVRLAQQLWDGAGSSDPVFRAEVALLQALSIRDQRREETVAVLQLALDTTPEHAAVRARLHQVMSIAVMMLGDADTSLLHARQAATLAAAHQDHALQARALCSVARAHRVRLATDQARQALEAAHRLAVARSCLPIAVFAEAQLALLLGLTGALEDAIHHADRAWELAHGSQVAPNSRTVAAQARGMTWAYAGPTAEALDVLDACIDVIAAGSAVRRELELLRTRVDLCARGPIPPVLEGLTQAIDAVRLVDNDRFLSEMEATLGLALLWAGEHEAAVPVLARAIEIARRAGFAPGERVARAIRVVGCCRLGQDASDDLAWLDAHPGPCAETVPVARAVANGAPLAELPRYALLDARLLHRLAQAALPDELQIGPGFARVTWHARAIDLSRRHPARRVFATLVQLHPAEATSEDLIAAGWPGEQLAGTSGRMRLHTTVRLLRKLGLEEAIETTEQGYRITPQVRLRHASDQSETFSGSIS